ncbi:MAG: pilus assembly protein PilP [Methanophagales archaeon]|nr:pilus assembly protein PilP [Methanophagales archaeon]
MTFASFLLFRRHPNHTQANPIGENNVFLSKYKTTFFIAGIIWTLFFFFSTTPGRSQMSPDHITAIPSWLKPSPYHYHFINKPDPFQPFIKPEPLSKTPASTVPSKMLTPLERIQPTQLNLVGILFKPNNPSDALALVELPDGKGYVLKKGTKVGHNQGVVTSILPNEIVIIEKAKNLFGELHNKKIVLKLHNKATGAENE